MTRPELVAALAARFPTLSMKNVDLSVAEIVDAIYGAIVKGDRVEIRGFGSFGHSYRAPRTARNPKTNAPVAVPAKFVPYFKPGKKLRESVLTQRTDLAEKKTNRWLR